MMKSAILLAYELVPVAYRQLVRKAYKANPNVFFQGRKVSFLYSKESNHKIHV